MIDRMIADTGLGPILKSWLILDNHDTPRLKTMLPKPWQQRMAQVLQFTLPGSPCLYYGVEVGMTGGHDPQVRGPMRWDLVNDKNQDLAWVKTLLALRRASRALKIGDFRRLDSERLLAFMRRTDRVAETAVVVANATDKSVTEVLAVPESKFINHDRLRDRLGRTEGRISSGMLEITVPAQTACVLMLAADTPGDHNPHKRVQ
jgi:glycosidase